MPPLTGSVCTVKKGILGQMEMIDRAISSVDGMNQLTSSLPKTTKTRKYKMSAVPVRPHNRGDLKMEERGFKTRLL